MLNESAFGQVRTDAARCICPFEKAILSAHCLCSLSTRHHIAERESISCRSAQHHAFCIDLHRLLQEKALFALKLPHGQQKLPHAKEMKIQCGGLLGLDRVVCRLDEDPATVEDIRDLVARAMDDFGTLEALPYSEIVKSIAAFEIRQKRQ